MRNIIYQYIQCILNRVKNIVAKVGTVFKSSAANASKSYMHSEKGFDKQFNLATLFFFILSTLFSCFFYRHLSLIWLEWPQQEVINLRLQSRTGRELAEIGKNLGGGSEKRKSIYLLPTKSPILHNQNQNLCCGYSHELSK